MKYQNNKDLAEAQFYLKMLDDFCKSGQVKIPDPTGTAMPWNLKEDPLKDYLIHLFTLKVTIPETGEEVQKFVRQVVNSKIKSKVFYDCVGKFIVECVHHMRFQRQRAWTESHRADDVLPLREWMSRCGFRSSTSWSRNTRRMDSISLSS